MAKQSLSQRIYSDAAYTEIVRIIGYEGITYPLPKEVSERLSANFAQDRLNKATDELISYDSKIKLATLKACVRKLCFGLLGPPPEEWHWACPERQQDSQTEAVDLGTNHFTNEPKPEIDAAPTNGDSDNKHESPRRWVTPPEMSAEAMVRRLNDSELMGFLNDARWGANHYGQSRKSRVFKKDLALAESEFRRRGLEVPAADLADIDRLGRATTTRLKELLGIAEFDMSSNDPSTITFQEASRELGLILMELRRRSTRKSQF